VRKHGLCKLCLGRCIPEGMCKHKECRWRNWIWHELCQEKNKCRRRHHRLLHMNAEDERSLQAARPAKPAKPPNRLRRSPACSCAKTSRAVPAVGEETLSTSRMLAGASEVVATQEGSRRLRGREPRFSRDVDSGTEGRRQELLSGISLRGRVTGTCPSAWPDESPGGSRVPPKGSRDPRSSKEPRPLWAASSRWSEGEATCGRSSDGRPQQEQRVAGEHQTAAGRCEREQMGQVTNTAQPRRRVCPEIQELYLNIQGIRDS
jgi:hypothetical protein